jgi:hypothetical protein
MVYCATDDHRLHDRFVGTITDHSAPALVGMSMFLYKNMKAFDGVGCLALV